MSKLQINKINGRYVLSNNGEYVTSSDDVSNLNLEAEPTIAAAPELLAAVKSMLLYIETYGGEVTANFSSNGNIEFYRALLAKAEGKEK